jgi:hypothetical protein
MMDLISEMLQAASQRDRQYEITSRLDTASRLRKMAEHALLQASLLESSVIDMMDYDDFDPRQEPRHVA